MVFSLYCTAELIFVILYSIMVFFDHCTLVFLCLCFYAFVLCILCSIGNIVTIISYRRPPARRITPFWHLAYRLLLYLHGENRMTQRSLVLTHYQRVTDRRTDRQTDTPPTSKALSGRTRRDKTVKYRFFLHSETSCGRLIKSICGEF